MPKILTANPDDDLQVQIPVDGEPRDATPSYQPVQALLNKIARLERDLANTKGTLNKNTDFLRHRRIFTGHERRIFLEEPADYVFLGRFPFVVPKHLTMKLSEVSFYIPGNDGVQLDLETRINNTQVQRHFFDGEFRLQTPDLELGNASGADALGEIAIAIRRDTPFTQTQSSLIYAVTLDFEYVV